jgi:hypothetical protein
MAADLQEQFLTLSGGKPRTMNVTPTSHPAAQLKDFPNPSRGARPTANFPEKIIRR